MIFREIMPEMRAEIFLLETQLLHHEMEEQT